MITFILLLAVAYIVGIVVNLNSAHEVSADDENF